MSKQHFHDLPTEVTINILAYLDPKSLRQTVQTCKKLQQIFKDSSRLQYISELELAGMQDNPYCPNTMTVSERLERLYDREASWATLENDFLASIPVPRSSSIYDVTPNAYLLGIPAPNGMPLTVGIQSLRMPSSNVDAQIGGVEVRTGKHIIDFGTSLEENDLLAVVTIARDFTPEATNPFLLEVTLLRHSAAAHHDEAAKAELRLVGVNNLVSLSIEISGENLAITVAPHFLAVDDDENGMRPLRVYNWKKGTQKGATVLTPNLGLVYLRSDLLLMPNISSHTLDIYHIPDSRPGVDDATLNLTLLAKLALPTVSPNHRVLSFQCRCDPSPTPGNKFPKYSPTNRPFANDPTVALMILEMRVQDITGGEGGAHVTEFLMFVHRKALLELLPIGWEERVGRIIPTSMAEVHEEKVDSDSATVNRNQGGPLSESTTGGGEQQEAGAQGVGNAEGSSRPQPLRPDQNGEDVLHLPWEAWGPQRTRWLDAEKFSSAYITSTAGQRYVCVDKTARTTPGPITILDFNPYHVRKAKVLGECEQVVEKVVGAWPEDEVQVGEEQGETDREKRACKGKGVFADEWVESRLPYMKLVTPTERTVDAVMLDEQRILCLRNVDDPELSEGTRQLEILHYG